MIRKIRKPIQLTDFPKINIEHSIKQRGVEIASIKTKEALDEGKKD